MLPNIYCINLKKRTDRRSRMVERFKARDLFDKVTFIDAIDKNSCILDYYTGEVEDQIPQEWNLGEVACFASHLKALRTYLETDRNGIAVICEDDVLLHNEFSAKLRILIKELPKDFPVCSLSYFPIDKKLYERVSPNIKKMGYDNIWGTQMYIISKEYALDCLFWYDRPRFGFDTTGHESSEDGEFEKNEVKTSEVILRKSLGYLAPQMLAIEECEDSNIRRVTPGFPEHTLAFCKMDYEDYSNSEAELCMKLGYQESRLKSEMDYRIIKLIKYRREKEAIKIAEKLLRGIRDNRLSVSKYDYSRIIDELIINLYYTNKDKAKKKAEEYIKIIHGDKEFKKMFKENPEHLAHMNENFDYLGLTI